MGKRSDFKRRKNDMYDTPYKAVLPLLPFLSQGITYLEPCAGKGDLIEHLYSHKIYCEYASDIEPRAKNIAEHDFTMFKNSSWYDTLVITNPPWTRQILHPFIEIFRKGAGCWLLFDADWMHTKQAIPYLKYCEKIVAVGRVKWIPDSPHVGKDNACWYFFGPNECETIFYGMSK